MIRPKSIQALEQKVGQASFRRWEEEVDDLLRLAAWARVVAGKIIPGTIQPWEREGTDWFDPPKRGKVYDNSEISQKQQTIEDLPIAQHCGEFVEQWLNRITSYFPTRSNFYYFFNGANVGYTSFTDNPDLHVVAKDHIHATIGVWWDSFRRRMNEVPRNQRTREWLLSFYLEEIQQRFIYIFEGYPRYDQAWFYDPTVDLLQLFDVLYPINRILFGKLFDQHVIGRKSYRSFRLYQDYDDFTIRQEIEKVIEVDRRREEIEQLKDTHWTVTEYNIRASDEYIEVASLEPSAYEISEYFPHLSLKATKREIEQAKRIGYSLFLPTIQNVFVQGGGQHPKVAEEVDKQLKLLGAREEGTTGTLYTLPFAVAPRSEEYWKIRDAIFLSKTLSTVEGYLKRRDNLTLSLDKTVLLETSHLLAIARIHFIQLPKKTSAQTAFGLSFVQHRINQIIQVEKLLAKEKSKLKVLYLLCKLARLKMEIIFNVANFENYYHIAVGRAAENNPFCQWNNYLTMPSFPLHEGFAGIKAEQLVKIADYILTGEHDITYALRFDYTCQNRLLQELKKDIQFLQIVNIKK